MEKGKAFDLNTMTVVDKPAGEDETQKEIALEEQETEESDEVEEEESEEETEETEAQEESEESEEDESEEETESEKEDEESEEETTEVDADEIIKDKFSDYEIETVDELMNVLDNLLEQNEELKKKETEKQAVPEDILAAADFLVKTGYKPGNFSEGLLTHAKLVSMDIDNSNGKEILREKYIMENTELTRSEAERMFEKRYSKEFVPDRNKFETDEEYNEAVEDAKIEEKQKVAKAKAFLKQKQKESKVTVSNKNEEQAEISETVTRGIEQTSKEYGKYLEKFNSLKFQYTDNDEDDFVFKFKPEQIKAINAAVQEWVKNPNSYDSKGVLKGDDASPEKWIQRASWVLFGEEMIAANFQHTENILRTKRVEEISKVKPTRKSTAASPVKGNLSEERQIERLIAKKKAKMGKR
jgi:hypothetical protein